MRKLSSAGIGVALAVACGVASSAHSTQLFVHRFPQRVVPQRAVPQFQPAARFARYAVTPKTCTDNSGSGFVGVASASSQNYAGGPSSAVVGGTENEACDQYDFIGGGSLNDIGNSGSADSSAIADGQSNAITGSHSLIGGGNHNAISGSDAFIGGGELGLVTGNGSVIAGGDYSYGSTTETTNPGNTISGVDSFIGSGDQNTIGGNQSFIGSGLSNTIGTTGSSGAILGGARNNISNQYSTILGGFGNSATGSYAIVLGGDANVAGAELTLAGGYHADATHTGSFVWSDFSSGSSLLKDKANNQFVVRASGGTTFYSNEKATSGVTLTAGSGAWANLSDRNVKTAVVPLDDDSILAKVSSLPIDAWSYTTERGIRHVGPMAQDFYKAFGTGVDDRHITSIDEDGVALAAIKALDRKLEVKTRQNASLESRLRSLEKEVAILAKRG